MIWSTFPITIHISHTPSQSITHTFIFFVPRCYAFSSQFLHLLSLLPVILLINKTFLKGWLLKSSAPRSLFRCISCLPVYTKSVQAYGRHSYAFTKWNKIFRFSVTAYPNLSPTISTGLTDKGRLLHTVTFSQKPRKLITTILEKLTRSRS